MSNYIAVGYACNQFCKGCPCKRKENINFSMEDLKERVDIIADRDDHEVTLSGGEPTVHTDFLELVQYLMKKGIYTTILTNAEKFAEPRFLEAFWGVVELDKIRIITTIHSSEASIHEEQNGKKGSFQESLDGLQRLFLKGIPITIKHCISKANYLDTKNFIEYMDDFFHPSVSIQLWGLDYSGLSKEDASELFIKFEDMQGAFEEALDCYLERAQKNGRELHIFNIPLCAADPYYWDLFVKPSDREPYGKYFDPRNTVESLEDDAGKESIHCNECYVKDICIGTYKSAFEYFGNDIVKTVYEG